MEETTLKAEKREILGKKVKKIRTAGQIPAVLYGRKTQNVALSLDRKEFFQLQKTAGEATLINLEIQSEKPINVLIRDIQHHPVSEEITHVDLYQVDMTKEIETEIPLEFTGTSAAVTELEGNLISNKDSIKVKCLPNKLVPEITVDISNLKTFEDLIHVKDLVVPEGIEVLDDQEEIIAQVTPPRSDEEIAEMEQETTAEAEKAQIETIEKEAAAEKAEKEAQADNQEEISESPPTAPKEEK